tara:strand:- start:19938 stop:22292 length:2355 start_codon:yes stop_codon:yes gene_type:complete
MKNVLYLLVSWVSLFVICCCSNPSKGQITSAGEPAQLDIRLSSANSIRVTLKPVSFENDFPLTPALNQREYPEPLISLREIKGPVMAKLGNLQVKVHPDPLTVTVTNSLDELVQEITFQEDGNLSFKLDDQPVLGMGEGGPRAERGTDWRSRSAEFDRRGRLHKMEPRWQSNAYGSRNPVSMLVGTRGWGLFLATPWAQVDLRNKYKGVFIPWNVDSLSVTPQTQKNQHEQKGKGIHPVDSMVPGLYDLFVFDANNPAKFMEEVSSITGPAVIPPKWALGYMQSHRTLKDEREIIGIVDTFREKEIPVDAVIYLGTGFTPSGWNKEQPSFEYNTEVFEREGREVISDLHDRNVKVVLHVVPDDREELPTLQGSIPPKADEELDPSHISVYWEKHIGLVKDGVDGFWPDEGDWFNLFERIKRHQMYYQGPLSTVPNIRPWSLHRNGYLGVAKWGGWVWSGDTDASWKTLETQIAVGINHSLSLSPFWGSDIGGFYSNKDKTGELYARWFQFGAFNASFRSHARTWYLSLPWGFGLKDMGIRENTNDNDPAPNPERDVLQSAMNNPLIEPITKKYAELRYQLLPYNYTLSWEAHTSGMPMMRALWLHYPEDKKARGIGDEYLWGRDMLIAPVFKKGATSRNVYLPKGDWYDWWTNKKIGGGQTIDRSIDLSTMPIYVRAGAIIPFDPIRQYTAEKATRPTTIRIYQGADGDYMLYEDDGTSLDYIEGAFSLIHITWNNTDKILTIAPKDHRDSQGKPEERTLKLELLPEGTVKEVLYSGEPVEVSF